MLSFGASRTRILVALSLASGLVMPAHAQSMLGVTLGETEAQAQVALGTTAKPLPITGKPGASMLFNDRGHVLLCNGRVVSVQEKVGRTLHDFAAVASDLEAKLGPGELRLTNDRGGSGEYSGVELEWPQPYGSTRVSFWQLGPQPQEVVREINAEDPCGS